MNFMVLAIIAFAGSIVIAGSTFAVYSWLPEEFLNHANLGRYSGLTAGAADEILLPKASAVTGPATQNE